MKCTAPKSQDGDKGGHDWALVKSLRDYADGTISRLLWACPCGEFQWTSYAKWEKSQPAGNITTDSSPDATGVSELLRARGPKHTGEPGAFEAHAT